MSDSIKKRYLPDEQATEQFGADLARALQGRGLVTLSGNLGTGKTTLSRGLLRALGHTGAVKSPTYTIVEPYEFDGFRVMHFDLYRLADPEELEFLGFRDYLDDNTLCLVEWPEKGQPLLPNPDLQLNLEVKDRGRLLSWHANTPLGEQIASLL